MTISQKRAIWYSYRDKKFLKFREFIIDNNLEQDFHFFWLLGHYVYFMNSVRFFCKKYGIVYNSRSNKYEKRT